MLQLHHHKSLSTFLMYINIDKPQASIYISVILTAIVVPSLWEFKFIFL